MSHGGSVKRAGLIEEAAVALLAPASALLIAELIHSVMGLTRLSLLFLAAVTVAASIRGRRAAVVAAIIGVLCFKLFLDLRTIEETSPAEDLINLAIFLVVALITGTLAGKVHDEAARSRLHAQRMEMLFKASRVLSEEDEDTFWPALAGTLAHASGGPAAALDSDAVIRAESGGTIGEDSRAIQLARKVLGSPENAIVRDGSWSARAISSEGSHHGILVWQAQDANGEVDRVIDLLAELASASLARSQVRREQVRIRAAEEAGRLREALLSSISHDFRSPLSAIIGSSTSLLEYGDKFDEAVRQDLLLNIQHEGEKLNQFVANLLNMTRLQSGVITPAREPLSVADVVFSAKERLERHKGEALPIRIQGSCDVESDALLLEQAVYNVLDNAVRYGNPAQGIEVLCNGDAEWCRIVVTDRGPGLPEEDLSDAFTSFHFVRKTGRTHGTGLGLSVSRGFVEAMGGEVGARNRSDGRSGLEVVMKLPKARQCNI